MPRVLIIDDDPSVRGAVEALLELHDFAVASAENGADAFRLLQESLIPDAILVDLMMPVMDGWQFIRELRSRPKYESTPVIVMSAVAPENMSGVQQTLLKPVEPASLLEVIHRAIQDASRSQRAAP